MKKYFLLLLLPFMPSLTKAQIALAKDNGTPITNGQIFTYNTTTEETTTLHYKIKNTSSVAINLRIKITNIQNATGSGFQFCYLNTCLPSVALNGIYPSNSSSPITIGANSETPAVGYNMWNSNTGSGVFPIDYVVKYYLVDAFNNEYGTPVSITYRYDPTAILAVNDVKKDKDLFALISTTYIKNNTIEVISDENVSYNLYSMDGRVLLSGNLKKGKENINISTLTSETYIIALKNQKGEIISKKISKAN